MKEDDFIFLRTLVDALKRGELSENAKEKIASIFREYGTENVDAIITNLKETLGFRPKLSPEEAKELLKESKKLDKKYVMQIILEIQELLEG